MADIKINGIEELQAKLKKNVTMDAVKTVVQHNGEQLDNTMKRQAVFTKGYSTGDTARSIMLSLADGGFTAKVGPGTDYAVYVEYGTRFMAAQPFIKPAFEVVKPKFLEDLKKLCVQGVAKIDPQQEIFTKLKVEIEKNYNVFDGALPPANTPYPFVYLGEVTLQDDYGNKSMVLANVNVTIHVWSDDFTKRGTHSEMLRDVKEIARGITETTNYSWTVLNIYQRQLEDNTTKTPLLHGVLEIEYKLLGG